MRQSERRFLYAVTVAASLAYATGGVVSVVRAASPAPAQAPRDMGARAAASPSTVTRAFSDAWHYNALQTSVLEVQRDRVLAELARLEADRRALAAQARDQFDVDLAAGDAFDEKTLVITRKRATQ